MWIRPKEVLVSGPLWYVERANTHFILQGRKGKGDQDGLEASIKKGGQAKKKGGGLSGLLVGTWDSVMDIRPPTYRSVSRPGR